ncbi:MAG TPA: calcium-translocating P-type ATPase, PMCA-type [Gemmataceae bacterium]|nr:calcium-translocating P-type ATPase, PMCA-type [Gemmataceae bacterium]
MRTLREIADLFPGAEAHGLTHDQVAESLSRFGTNRLTPLPHEPAWRKLFAKFDEPIIKILLAATLLKTVVDLFANVLLGVVGAILVAAIIVVARVWRLGPWLPALLFGTAIVLVGMSVLNGQPSVEGLAVMLAVALATGVAFISEYRSDREFASLNAQKEALHAKVFRDGRVELVAFDDVVIGDLIVLEMGDEVPADGRLTQAREMLLDQSLLTGESEPAPKSVPLPDDASDGPDQFGCIYRGTQVVDGAGQMIATEVGDLTMLGQLARRLSADDVDEQARELRVRDKLSISKTQTPLQLKLTRLASTISRVGYVAAIAIFVVLMVRGIGFTYEVRLTPTFVVDPVSGGYLRDAAGNRVTDTALGPIETTGQVLRDSLGAVVEYFVYMVIIIVVAVPEGLPMSVTVSLALAMRKMTRSNSLVRQLMACETIGSVTVICSDKTGTLTENRMQVEQLGLGGVVHERATDWPQPTADRRSAIDWLALNAGVNSTAHLDQRGGKAIVIGNTTEGALLRWLGEAGLDYAAMRAAYPLRSQLHFSSDRKRMLSVVEHEQQLIALLKGAPEVVLALCTHRAEANDAVVELTQADRDVIARQLGDAAGRGMRVLAFAHRTLPDDFSKDEDALNHRREEIESNLVFAGFAALRDAVRPEVSAALARCRSAGIDVKVVTGDNVETARAIATDAGLQVATGDVVWTSEEYNRLTDDEAKKLLPRLRILARARPLDKLRLVRLLQEQGHVVAVTGDGTNDAPALTRADVGLAMGVAGTEVAKAASNIILLDDSFATIVRAVHWGRSLYENIQRFLQFQLTINVSALAIALLGPFLGVRPPFTVLQLLWINVIMDTFAAIALCSEPPRSGLMRQAPKRRDENIVTPTMQINIMATAAFFVLAMLALLVGMKAGWFAGTEPPSAQFAPLTTRQVSIFFTVYVMFQLWNQINCRALTPEHSGLRHIWRNATFLGILMVTLVGQVLIVTFGGSMFAVEPLSLVDWLAIVGATSSVLIFAEVVRRFRRARAG